MHDHDEGQRDLPTGGFPGLNMNSMAPHFRDDAAASPVKRPWLRYGVPAVVLLLVAGAIIWLS